MPKIIVALLLLLLVNHVFTQDAPVMSRGQGMYLPGQAITTVMNKLGAEKKLVFKIKNDGKISGNLLVTYNKSRAQLDGGSDQDFTINGQYDNRRKLLLLIITHTRSQLNGAAEIAFTKPDSVYYITRLEQRDNKTVMTATVSGLMSRNQSAEWIGSAHGEGLGMNVGDMVNMHLLPLLIQLETTREKDSVGTVMEFPIREIRKKEIQHTIVLDTSLIKIDMYDNGEIDGDIATLILDGEIIMDNKLLSTKAASLSLDLSKDPPEHILELFANNLGSIPPNTALLVLTCGSKRYEVNLSSNTTVNGSVKLVFKTNNK